MLGCVVDSVVFKYFIFHGVSRQLCSREVGIMQNVDVAMECWCHLHKPSFGEQLP